MGPVAETNVRTNGRRDSPKGRRQLLARYRRLPLAKRRRQAGAFRAELSRLSPSDDAAARHWRKDFQPLLQDTITDGEAAKERLAEEARRLREAAVAAREKAKERAAARAVAAPALKVRTRKKSVVPEEPKGKLFLYESDARRILDALKKHGGYGRQVASRIGHQMAKQRGSGGVTVRLSRLDLETVWAALQDAKLQPNQMKRLALKLNAAHKQTHPARKVGRVGRTPAAPTPRPRRARHVTGGDR
jgi:hypothetical protein